MELAKEKEKNLIEAIKGLGKIAVAFSGGVDSTYLLSVASETLSGNAVALTACTSTFSKREQKSAIEFCESNGIRQILFEASELDIEGYKENPPNRCYLCKTAIFGMIKGIAQKEGIPYICDGSNVDDEGDYRPGRQALRELDILSPLKDSGLTKEEIRLLSRERGLQTWDKPSFACLASRFPYGETITKEGLEMVENAEDYLFGLGIKQLRVRVHSKNIARIETDEEGFKILTEKNTRDAVYGAFKKIGFEYSSLDLKGYRYGSMNEALKV